MTETWNSQSWKDLQSKISQFVSTTEGASVGNAKKLMVDLYDFGEYIQNNFTTTMIHATKESKLIEECLKNWYQICEKNNHLENTNNLQRVKIDNLLDDLKIVRNEHFLT